MKKILYFILAAGTLLLAACGASNDEQSQHNQEQRKHEVDKNLSNDSVRQVDNMVTPDLTSGLDQVLASIDELKTAVENTPSETEKIHAAGKAVEESWDQIEKQVEEVNLKEYSNIENSLYPLFDEVTKDKPDVVKLKQLIDESIPKLKNFKETLGN
ncbi:hypothetical protein [Virgibacillus oceani]|uniref:Lipoprotein n=1 Tax=Virgibacillus oceani TaxID=1479511 RepID=A0A917HJV2_9BACI|nr:hypothetical protein [Virgibacillus oceani]GGG80973.1 hypothetical protein GCM10011398_27970 [Virgibacillus oceani]